MRIEDRDDADQKPARRRPAATAGPGTSAAARCIPCVAYKRQQRGAAARHADDAEQPELPIMHGAEMRHDERREIAEVKARDRRADHRGDDDGREGARRIVAEHDLVGEEHAGDRRVERGGDRGADAAAEQGQGARARQPQAPRDPRADGGAEMHDRPLATDRGAGAERDAARQRRRRAPSRSAMRPPLKAAASMTSATPCGRRPGHDVIDEQADRETARRRHRQDLPPGQRRRRRRQIVAGIAEADALDEADQPAEADGAVGGDGAGQQRQDIKDELLVAQQPEPARPRARGRRDRPSVPGVTTARPPYADDPAGLLGPRQAGVGGGERDDPRIVGRARAPRCGARRDRYAPR